MKNTSSLFSLIALSMIMSCSPKAESQLSERQKQIRSVKATQILPAVDISGKITSVDTSTIQIFYLGNQVVYKILTRYPDPQVRGYNMRLKGYSYLATTDTDSTGDYFAVNDTTRPKTVNNIFILGNEWFGNVNVNQLFVDSRVVKFKVEPSAPDSLVHEYYELADNFDSAFHRSVHVFFEKKRSELFVKPTRDIDKRRNMRMVKFQMHTPKQFSKEMKETISEYDLIYLVEDVVLTPEQQISISKYFKQL